MIDGMFIVTLLMSEMNVYIMGKSQESIAFQWKINRLKYEVKY